ncbi:XP_014786661.1PREDICTED: uncharacterized protein LOC106880990 [Octopus vulgaris]|uniref:XP_014786661.1PREDICTED: uncharacterized protein LOC106880990 n=1 Tax=Octopus vulgaris TaxID=6645 RepID=A0AA36AVD5_OCTVU|nr:XP_014786661.1PREDICTED: uncharacterized protein LOC106880990 [Octopus vulgaris]
MTNVTLKKYLEKLTQEVEKKISDELPSKVSFVIDGWTKGLMHFTGLFASCSYNYQNDYCTVLLAFLPMVSETSFAASDYVEFIENVLSIYNKNLENVVAITGDNTEVNKSVANLCRISLIRCASHKFNLAVSAYLDKQEVLLDKINILMGKLKSSKFTGKLREKTPLQPIQRNKTCWSSTYET